MVRQKHFLFAVKVSTRNGNLFEVGENTVYHVAFDLGTKSKGRAILLGGQINRLNATELSAIFKQRKLQRERQYLDSVNSS